MKRIVLDTDVISALFRPELNPKVADWAGSLGDDQVYLTTTTASELILGVMSAPEGRRRNELDDIVAAVLSAFSDRLYDFDFYAALEYGRFVPDRLADGRPIARADAQIAACCIANGAALATRNTKHFQAIPGLEVIDPWSRAG